MTRHDAKRVAAAPPPEEDDDDDPRAPTGGLTILHGVTK
jgi:hypothetical protein